MDVEGVIFDLVTITAYVLLAFIAAMLGAWCYMLDSVAAYMYGLATVVFLIGLVVHLVGMWRRYNAL